MSRPQQLKFLGKLHRELTKDKDSDVYRKKVADIRLHEFTITQKALKKGIYETIDKHYKEINFKKVLSKVQKGTNGIASFVDTMGTRLANAARPEDSGITLIKKTSHTVIASFEASANSQFDAIKNLYEDKLNLLALRVAEAMQKLGQKDKLPNKNALWSLEHNEFKGVIESQVKDAVEAALKLDKIITYTSMENWFRQQGVDLVIIRDSKTDTMEVFIGSTVKNLKEGGISGAKSRKLKEVLKRAINRLQWGGAAWPELGGSDSFKESKMKKTRREALKPFKKLSNVKVSSKDIKAENSKTSVKKSSAPKVTILASKAKQRKAIRVKKQRTSTRSMLEMVGLINDKLSETVKGNMKSPALVNRSGRFAESVRVTDIIKTPKGFPSVGYTYQTRPYDTFEMGGAQGTPDRDPRKLIDASIREIAAKMAIGRFYTRRV